MTPVRAVLLDLDDTLCDSEGLTPIRLQAVREALADSVEPALLAPRNGGGPHLGLRWRSRPFSSTACHASLSNWILTTTPHNSCEACITEY